jgi:hypothetical protein
MSWPFTFGVLTSPAQLSDFDANFNQVAAMIDIPCSVSGTNALSLTPLVNCPVLTAYTEFCAARFRAGANSTNLVTAQISGLGFLPVYHADGATQATINDLVASQEYVVRFSQSLNAGAGGWFLEAPASPTTPILQSTQAPGGRLTFQSATPVMSSSQTSQIIYYAPYVSPLVPIYNGTTISMVQFTSGQSDQVGLSFNMGGSATWPASTAFDVFVTLIAGSPKLCTTAWTNSTTRNIGLAIFGGFLTNASTANAQTPSGTINLPVNQGTFLGSFFTNSSNGTTNFLFGSAASGGGASAFNLCNYYNKVLVNSIVQDNGAPYTYTTATARSARGSFQNAHSYMQSDSERAAIFSYQYAANVVAVTGASIICGLGVNTTTVYTSVNQFSNATNAAVVVFNASDQLSISATGFTAVNMMETGDGVNANTFDRGSINQLFGSIWL